MRKIAASYIFTNIGDPIKNGILLCNDQGEVIEIIGEGGQLKEMAGMEFYSGILVPGFICPSLHLNELSKVISRKLWSAGIVLAFDINDSNACRIDYNTTSYQGIDPIHDLKYDAQPDVSFRFDQPFKPGDSFLHQLFLLQENEHRALDELFKELIFDTAKYFGCDSIFGSFEKGKKPGLNLITGLDYNAMKLTASSKIKRLI